MATMATIAAVGAAPACTGVPGARVVASSAAAACDCVSSSGAGASGAGCSSTLARWPCPALSLLALVLLGLVLLSLGGIWDSLTHGIIRNPMRRVNASSPFGGPRPYCRRFAGAATKECEYAHYAHTESRRIARQVVCYHCCAGAVSLAAPHPATRAWSL